ncbi:hypothetical protein Pint_34483 [Pistacia integerrima]|uniref:Uncharacterized protein n=1 Tax=Pistacia integerrima TaxID=434235 RepID=A0ACC0X653_9ROSI|nr:hypothetical protein Pint_34483 [Pistacia integerrima]
MSNCATVAFVLVNRLSETSDNHLNALKNKDIKLKESAEMNLKKDALLSDQAAAIEEAEKQIQSLRKEVTEMEETYAELVQKLSDEERRACAMEQKLEDIEKNDISMTREEINRANSWCILTEGHAWACIWKIMEALKDMMLKGIVNLLMALSVAETCKDGVDVHTVGDMRTYNSECSSYVQKQMDSRKSSEMARLNKEKEEMLMSKKQNEKSMKCLRSQVLTLQAAMSNFEKQSELKIQTVNHKLQAFEQIVQEAGSHWNQTKEILEVEFGDAKIVAAQKAAEAFCIFSKFEEAQDTIREADIIINGLMIANETMKLDIRRLKQTEVTLNNERDTLMNEVLSLQSINSQKDQQFENLEKQFGSNLIETRNLVVELEHIIADTRKSWCGHGWKDVWAEIIVKDCAMAVLHLCHMGLLLESVTGLNAENGLLQHGLSESNSVIADLREHNFKSKRELEMCRVLKGKLLADIKRSFDQISRKEEEAGELSGKLIRIKRKLLQDKEELLKSEAEFLLIDLCSKELESLVFASQLEEMALQKTEAERMNISCGAVFDNLKEVMIFSKVDAELKKVEATLLQEEVEEAQNNRHEMQSKLEQSFLRITQMDVAKKALEQDIQSLQDSNRLLQNELGEITETKVSLLNQVQALEAECNKLQKDLKIKGTELESSFKELDMTDVELSRMRDLEEENNLLKNEVRKLQTENNLVLQDLAEKKSEFESSLSHIDTRDMENHRLRDKVFSLETCIAGLQTDMEMKNAELSELHHTQSITLQDLSSKGQEIQIYMNRVNILREENVFLRNDVKILENDKRRALSMSSQNISKCVDSVKAVDMICSRLLNKIYEEGFMIADEMFHVICENAERISKFIKGFECLECHVEELISQNRTLQAELSRKDEVLEGLSFDLSLLQESASNTKDQKDEIEEMVASLEALEDDLALKSSELDEAVAHRHMLEAQLQEKINEISTLQIDISGYQETLKLLSSENRGAESSH